VMNFRPSIRAAIARCPVKRERFLSFAFPHRRSQVTLIFLSPFPVIVTHYQLLCYSISAFLCCICSCIQSRPPLPPRPYDLLIGRVISASLEAVEPPCRAVASTALPVSTRVPTLYYDRIPSWTRFRWIWSLSYRPVVALRSFASDPTDYKHHH
jgi:hypothetical protein